MLVYLKNQPLRVFFLKSFSTRGESMILKLRINLLCYWVLCSSLFLQAGNIIDLSQTEATQLPYSGTRYFSGEDGVLKLYVNIWGNVNTPGRLVIDEGVDILTAISLAGGPMSGANLKNIKLYREFPDTDGKVVYQINLDEYIDSGDKSKLIAIKPNDTIIIPEKMSSIIVKNMASVSTFMNLLNLYFIITSR